MIFNDIFLVIKSVIEQAVYKMSNQKCWGEEKVQQMYHYHLDLEGVEIVVWIDLITVAVIILLIAYNWYNNWFQYILLDRFFDNDFLGGFNYGDSGGGSGSDFFDLSGVAEG